jgi:LacI family gluconate utilization system Gnt-I transcriptional repressor
MPSPPRSPTLADVARHAGVSTITASRALSKPNLVVPATIERVQKAVDALGYVPNLVAGGLRLRRSRLVAVLVPALAMPQLMPALQALTETLDADGYQLIIAQSGFDHAREDVLIGTLLGRRPDGIVLVGLIRAEGTRQRLRASGIPVVETWDLDPTPVDMLVGFSHVAAGRAVARYLLDRGRHRIGVVTADDQRSALRLEGLRAEFGGEMPVITVPAPSTTGGGRTALPELLARRPDLDAICCSSDQLALGIIAGAQARGLRVPDDLAVCGYGDAEFARHIEPALTTVQVDGALIGRTAARFVIDRCAGRTVAERVVDVGFHIVARASA